VAEGRPQKYFGSVKGLADEFRAGHLAVLLDQAAVGLVREDSLGEAGDQQGVGGRR
jgi:hypothetical protein